MSKEEMSDLFFSSVVQWKLRHKGIKASEGFITVIIFAVSEWWIWQRHSHLSSPHTGVIWVHHWPLVSTLQSCLHSNHNGTPVICCLLHVKEVFVFKDSELLLWWLVCLISPGRRSHDAGTSDYLPPEPDFWAAAGPIHPGLPGEETASHQRLDCTKQLDKDKDEEETVEEVHQLYL